jgi:hypothetical protein
LVRIHDAQVEEHDSVLGRNKLGRNVHPLDLYGLFGEVDEGGTGGPLLPASLLVPLG